MNHANTVDWRAERSLRALLLFLRIFVPAALVLGGLIQLGCVQVGDDVNAPSATAIVNPPGSPAPGASPGTAPCGMAVTAVVVNAPETVRVGESARLDATPFAGLLQIPDECNAARAVTWQAAGPCSILGSGFNPSLRGDAPGSCEIRAVIDLVSSPARVVAVIP